MVEPSGAVVVPGAFAPLVAFALLEFAAFEFELLEFEPPAQAAVAPASSSAHKLMTNRFPTFSLLRNTV
jgi:hypothetical protein